MTFSDEALTKPTIYKGFKEFCHGHRSLSNKFHEGQRQLRTAMISGNVNAMQQMITLDYHITYGDNKALSNILSTKCIQLYMIV